MVRARLHAFVKGEVQMVGFRAFVADWADRLRLDGWVRNTRDGQVELVAEGEEPSLRALLDKVRQGPRVARVTAVKETWDDPTGEYSGFHIRG